MLPRIRNSARALVQNAAGEVLLLRFAFPAIRDKCAPSRTSFWVTPGGGLEEGETFEEALRRELREELGIEVAPNPRCLWVQDILLEDAVGPFISHERFYHVRLASIPFEPRVDAMSDIEKQTFAGYRWWSLAEMQADRDLIRPRELPELICNFIVCA